MTQKGSAQTSFLRDILIHACYYLLILYLIEFCLAKRKLGSSEKRKVGNFIEVTDIFLVCLDKNACIKIILYLV